MNRDELESALKRAGVSVSGWLPVLQCDSCRKRWEPFAVAVDGPSAPTARFDYWMCPNKCNADADVGFEIKTAIPTYVMIDDVPGMIFGDEDLVEFERYVRSMNATEVLNKDLLR